MAFRLPDSFFTVEVTVWHWQVLRNWDAMRRQLHTQLESAARKAGISRQVHIELPLPAKEEHFEYIKSKTTLTVLTPPRGEIPPSHEDAPVIKWFEIPIFERIEDVDFSCLPEGLNAAVSAGPGAVIGPSFGFSVKPRVSERWQEIACKSLRKSLDRKRQQRDPKIPHVIALAPSGIINSTGTGSFH